MPVTDFIIASLILLAGGFLTGVTSFGGNLFAIPLFTFLMGAQNAIAFGCVTGIAVMLGLALIYWRHLLWQEIILTGIPGLLGAPAGVLILTHAPGRVLLLAAGLCILLFLLWQLQAARLHLAEKPISCLWGIPAGFASGFMSGAIGMGGPPIILYAFCRKWGKENTIGTANLTVVLQFFLIVPMQWSGKLLPDALVAPALWGCLASVVGILISLPVVHRLNIRVFRAFLLALLSFSTILLIGRGLFA